jgi:hypothetical protein
VPLLKVEAKERQKQAGRFAGRDADGNPVQVPLHEEEAEESTSQKGEAAAIAAGMVGISRATVYRVKTPKTRNPTQLPGSCSMAPQIAKDRDSRHIFP